jgi:hypothetical protein
VHPQQRLIRADRSRLQPALFPGLDWGCGWASDQGQVLCNANALAFEVLDPFTPVTDCADGGTVCAKNSRNPIAKRYWWKDVTTLIDRHQQPAKETLCDPAARAKLGDCIARLRRAPND